MEILDHSGWLWALSLIVLTMAIHATAVVILAFVTLRMRVRLETRGLKVWNLIAILIYVVGVIGLLLAVLHGIECGIWAAAYLWLGALDSPMDALFYSLELDEHARRIRADASTALALDGRAGGSRRDATVRCEHGVPFLGDAGVLVNAHRARDPQPRLSATAAKQGVNLPCPPAIDARRAVTPDRKGNARYGANATFLPQAASASQRVPNRRQRTFGLPLRAISRRRAKWQDRLRIEQSGCAARRARPAVRDRDHRRRGSQADRCHVHAACHAHDAALI